MAAQSKSDGVRAAIYGAGAMGTALGAFIAESGRQIDLISRNREHVKALRRDGANIVGSVNKAVQVNALLPEEMTGKYDLIFLMTKQRENSEICKFLNDYLADNGVICTTQNGLPEPSVSRVVGADRCLGCAVSWGATRRKAGVVEITSDKKRFTFALGALTRFLGMDEKIELVKSYLECMGKVTVEENFLGARWSKLAVNSAFSALSALTGMTFGEIARGKKTRKLALDLLNEAFLVADKCGVTPEKIQGHDIAKIYDCRNKGSFGKKLALYLLPLAVKRHAKLISGMYSDLKDGKKSDIDFINGFIAHTGKKFGASTPLNSNVLLLAHKMEKGELSPSPAVINLLLK